jgi:hypothetical protein
MLLKLVLSLCAALVLTFPDPAVADQELRYREEPISLDQMGGYEDIRFNKENFEMVTNGMTEGQVLSVLGKPEDLRKMQRRHGRWTFHYFYPEGYVVNFRNGLVVGKEKN